MGGIDLSVGMLASLVSIVTALGISVWKIGVWPSIFVGIASAVVLETLVGFVISRTKVEPFIMTLGAMIAYQGIALLLCNSREVVMQGEMDFMKANLISGAIDPVNGLNLTITPYVVIFLLIVVIIWAVMKYSRFGRRIYAIGCNPNAAYLAGVNVKNTKLLVYAVHGLLVGIGAVLLLARINVGIITNGQNMEIDAIAMAVIGGIAMSGGKGNIWGTLIGILLLGSISNAMNMLRLPSEVSFVAKGVIIMVAVSARYLSPAIQKLLSKSRA
jgi:ribose/xylose/arabinose/galactoside ABC-type transport system permease subunit